MNRIEMTNYELRMTSNGPTNDDFKICHSQFFIRYFQHQRLVNDSLTNAF